MCIDDERFVGNFLKQIIQKSSLRSKRKICWAVPTKEMVMKAMQCKDADELIALAKTGGIELTKEEAETYMAELADFELDGDNLKKIAGGIFECYMRNDCMYAFDDWK